MPTERALKTKLLECYFELPAFPDALSALTSLKKADHKHRDPAGRLAENARKRSTLDAVLSLDDIRPYRRAPRAPDARSQIFRLAALQFGLPASIKDEGGSVLGASQPAGNCGPGGWRRRCMARHVTTTPKPFLRYRQDYG